MNNSRYDFAEQARRRRDSRRLALVCRLAMVVVVNLSAWIVADQRDPIAADSSIEFRPLPPTAESEMEALESATAEAPGDEASEADPASVDEAIDSSEEGEDLAELTDRVAVEPAELPTMSFLRPGWTAATDRYRPSYGRADHSENGFRVRVDTGVGYDSFTRNRPGDLPPIESSGAVTWLELGGNYSGDVSLDDGALFYYGANFGGTYYWSETDDPGQDGDSLDYYVNPYLGLQGQKTILQLDGFYDQLAGNDYFYEGRGRESLGADSLRTGARFTGVRLFDHSRLETGIDYTVEDFDPVSTLNDQESWIGDLSWYYQPADMPKTEAGFGVRFGEYFTDNSPDLSIVEPSLRMRYEFSPKTEIDGRVGYLFRDYSGGESAPGDGDLTFALGADWEASPRLRMQLEAYRESSPSLQVQGENFTSTGVRVDCGYGVPFLQLHLTLTGAYERADYESSTIESGSNRSDDYVWISSALSRRFDNLPFADTTVSLFYNYREIVSNDAGRDYDQEFGGIRMRLDF